jgi:UDP-3-O-[3-hydroxymyristoyl] glucosamine N-acyltransferase
MLAFAETVGHLRAAVAAGAVACIVPPGLVELVDEVDPAIGVLVAEAPRRSFADLHRWLAEDTEFYGRAEATVVDPSADVHPTAWIDPSGVMVGAAVRIGPRAVITGRAHLAPGVEVDAGAVVGAAGFQSDGGREMPHAGTVSIGVGTRVFANAVIARGVFHGATRIGARCRVGNLAFVSHHCTIGDDVHIGHGATVNGGVSVGDGAWVGPGVDLANGVAIGARARVSLGSTVIGDVAADGHVTGAVAIDHWSMLREVASWRRRRR